MKIASVRMDKRGRITIPMYFLTANDIDVESMVDITLLNPISEEKRVVLNFSNEKEATNISKSEEKDMKDLEIDSVDL